MPKNLYPHQEQAVDYLRKHSGGLLFMEMRLGKTLSAIRYIKTAWKFPALIVAPFSVMREWASQLQEDGENLVTVLTGTKKQRLEKLFKGLENSRWIISNYESIIRLQLHKYKWKSVIADESIRISNPKASITKYMCNYFKLVETKIALCGLPTPESTLQAFEQFRFVNNEFMGYSNYWHFRKVFCQTMYTDYDWEIKPELSSKVLKYIKDKAFIRTRKELNIGSDKIYKKRFVKMNTEQKLQIKKIKNLFEYETKEVKNALGQLISYSYIAGGLSCEDDHSIINPNKINELIRLIKENFLNQKIIIWCKYRAEQDHICDYLDQNDLSCIFINGDTKNREDLKRLWENDSVTTIAVLTIASSCKGLNWSKADTVIYYSNDFSNDKRSQSEDRIISTEKNNPVLIIDLLSENSVDEYVLKALKDKKFNADLVMRDYLKCL